MSAEGKSIKAMAAKEAKANVSLIELDIKPMGQNDVEFDVEFCGICHSDIHQIDNDWGMIGEGSPGSWPLVPGHEAAGTVTAVGSNVKKVKVGDKVVLGATNQSCGNCHWCKTNSDNICDSLGFTYVHPVKDEHGESKSTGGFGASIRTPASHIVKVPSGVSLDDAGVLACAGITVFAPLHHYFKKGMTVGVSGIGGLGHLGIQFAAKMGASDVIAFSHSDSKKELAMQLGATKFVNMSSADERKAAIRSCDLLLNTVSAEVNVDDLLQLMKKRGTLVFLGAPPGKLSFSVFQLLNSQIHITGHGVGSIPELVEMLKFAGKHGVKPMKEVFPHTKANEAIAKVRDGSIRFRAVLSNDLANAEVPNANGGGGGGCGCAKKKGKKGKACKCGEKKEEKEAEGAGGEEAAAEEETTAAAASTPAKTVKKAGGAKKKKASAKK